jgi:hypothetical protein
MNKLKETFETLIAEQKKLQAEFQVTAKALFNETTKQFFEINPGIKAFVWTQYSPFFNDGEECTFGVNAVTFTNAEGEDLEDVSPYGEYEGENESIWATESIKYTLEEFDGVGKDYYKEVRELILAGTAVDIESCELLTTMMSSNEFEPVMEAMFGNHVKVIATKEGFEVEEYDHD